MTLCKSNSSHGRTGKLISTMLGMVAILTWSVSPLLNRVSSESLGPWMTLTIVQWTGVLTVGLLRLFTRSSPKPDGSFVWQRITLHGLYVSYVSLVYYAVGCAANRSQALSASLLNSTWPSLVLLGSVWIFGGRMRPLFFIGQLLTVCGAFFALTQSGDHLDLGASLPLACALLSAFVWALYSNLMRKWEQAARGIMLGNLFIAATLLSCIFWEDLPSAIRIIPQVPAAIVLGVATNLAFVFWGSAMREGHARQVALAAYFIPVLTAATMCVFMGIPVTWKLAAASVFVAFGALLCKIAVTARRPVC